MEQQKGLNCCNGRLDGRVATHEGRGASDADFVWCVGLVEGNWVRRSVRHRLLMFEWVGIAVEEWFHGIHECLFGWLCLSLCLYRDCCWLSQGGVFMCVLCSEVRETQGPVNEALQKPDRVKISFGRFVGHD